jgi:UDP-N-acetylmuramyl pentapeptide synthase
MFSMRQTLNTILLRLRQRGWPVLAPLATLYRRALARRTRFVAVVGSFGKSSAVRAVSTALGVPIHRSFAANCFSGLALMVLRVRPWRRYGVIEAGIDNVGQMILYARIIRPDIVVVTSIGSEHNRSLGTLETTRHEKAEMVRALSPAGIAVLNGDDPNVLWMKSQRRARFVTFGFGEANDVRATDVRLDWPRGTRFTLHIGNESREMQVRLLGRHMLYPILAAVAVVHADGLDWQQALAALQELAPTVGRMETICLPNGVWIIRDDEKSTLETIHAALDVLAQVPARRRIVALGPASEPPGSQGPIYRDIGTRLAGIISLAVIIGSDRIRRSYAGGAESAGLARSAFLSADESARNATGILRRELRPGDVVLIKGRSEQRLERIALGLMGRAVRCDIPECRLKISACANCPMLERGR